MFTSTKKANPNFLHLNWLKAKSRRTGGFTIIEMLVVVTIMGVLSALSLPSFWGQVNKAKETEAQIAVNFLKKSQSIFYLENNKFSNNLQELNFYETETDNYIYLAQSHATLDGMVHIALAKREAISSYATVVYLDNSRLEECNLFSLDIGLEDSTFAIMRFVLRAINDSDEYCT